MRMHVLTSPVQRFLGQGKKWASGETHSQRAIRWVKEHRHPKGGLPPHHKHKGTTQEVTGYLIPTLYNWGEKDLAISLAKWEASVQRPNGAFVAPDTDVPYTFDTAQVIRGFLAVVDDVPEVEKNLRRACDYVDSQITPEGEVRSPSYEVWKLRNGETLTDYCNLYVLPPMLKAGRKLSEPKYVEAARRGMNYFRKKPDLVEFKPEMGTFSHMFGYMMEALVELGEVDLARAGLRQAAAIQKSNGAIPAYPGVEWVCSTGMAQLAIAWYMLGEVEPANRAVAYLEHLQHPSGGFYGGYGKGASYFPAEEISWAVKFFLDCLTLRASTKAKRL